LFGQWPRQTGLSVRDGCFWVVHPGQILQLLLKWQTLGLMRQRHEKGTQNRGDGQDGCGNNMVVGTGQMDWPAILKAAAQVRVSITSSDESPTAADRSRRLRYLEKVKW
jgi:hypothetical protein